MFLMLTRLPDQRFAYKNYEAFDNQVNFCRLMQCYHLSLEASRHPLTENKNKSKIRKQKHF